MLIAILRQIPIQDSRDRSGKSEKTEETYPLCCLYSFYKRITMPLIIKLSTGLWGERGPEKTRDEVLADTLPLPGRVSASPF